MATSIRPSRNDPCPCGSGMKYKKCCMPTVRPRALRIPPSAMRVVRKREQAERNRREKFGEVRPVIHADYRGYKFVAVDNEYHYSKHCRTFVDFLDDYIKRVLTPEWGKAELAKPFDHRHQIMKWYDSVCRHAQKYERQSDGLYPYIPSGAMRAYYLLAYDLYILRHHSALQADVIKRLKHKDQFQGARHELFAATTCIRAGYDIEYEDESDVSRKHPELIAKHRATGQQIAVEAKSRHRPGVLGRPGEQQPDLELRAGIERLFKNALAKPAAHPYVIFIDLNLPPTDTHVVHTRWFEEAAEPVLTIINANDGRAPFSLIVFSNQPDHYALNDAPAPVGDVFCLIGSDPSLPATHPEAIQAIHDAADKFGQIPIFEEAD